MPVWVWLVIAAALLCATPFVAGGLILRRSQTGRRFLRLSTRQKVAFARAAAGDPRLDRPAKWLMLGLLAYLLSPIDLVPDFVPVLGQLDDLLIVVVAIALLRRMVPRGVWEEVLVGVEAVGAAEPQGPEG